MKTGTLTASTSCCWKIALNPQLVVMALPYAPVPVVTMDTDGTMQALVGMVAWVIGAYIHHYELHGADRADYGDRLLPKLAERLGNEKMVRTQERELRRYRAFYVAYPQIRESVSPESSPDWRFSARIFLSFWGSNRVRRWRNLTWSRRCWPICRSFYWSWAMAFVWKRGKKAS